MPKFKAQHVIYATIALERFGFYLFLGALALWKSPADVGALLFWGYLAPLAGGYLGRHSLRGAVLGGACLLFAGYVVAALGHSPLSLLALGVGLFKPCLSALLGSLFQSDGTEHMKALRSKAFGKYYAAIQLGSMPSTLVGGYLHYRFGWAAAFGAAAMALGLCVALLLLQWGRLAAPRQSIAESVIDEAIARPQWGRLAVLCAGAVLFFAGFQQQQTSLVLWAKDVVRADMPESVSTLNPVFCSLLLLTPLASWINLRARLVCAMLALAAGFALLLFNTRLSGLVGWYFFATVGEVLISPLGLDMASALVPRRLASVATALWLASMAVGGLLAGLLGSAEPRLAVTTSLSLSLAGALWFFVELRPKHEQAKQKEVAQCPA